MTGSSFPDWITATASVATAIVALDLGFRTLRQQRTTTDVQLALDIFQEINRYWDRIADASPDNECRFEFGQILAQFELAATLFNNKTLSASALPILKDHIVEIFTSFQLSPEGQNLLQACQSSPDTFKELKTFARRHMPTALKVLEFRSPIANDSR